MVWLPLPLTSVFSHINTPPILAPRAEWVPGLACVHVLGCHSFLFFSFLNDSFSVMKYLVDISFQLTTPNSSSFSLPPFYPYFKTPSKHHHCWQNAVDSILMALPVSHLSNSVKVAHTIRQMACFLTKDWKSREKTLHGHWPNFQLWLLLLLLTLSKTLTMRQALF